MLAEMNQAKRFLGVKFGYGEIIQDGTFAIPTTTSKGDAFMKLEMKDGKQAGQGNFSLFWDEKLTISWYDKPRPKALRESKFAGLFRQIEECRE